MKLFRNTIIGVVIIGALGYFLLVADAEGWFDQGTADLLASQSEPTELRYWNELEAKWIALLINRTANKLRSHSRSSLGARYGKLATAAARAKLSSQ